MSGRQFLAGRGCPWRPPSAIAGAHILSVPGGLEWHHSTLHARHAAATSISLCTTRPPPHDHKLLPRHDAGNESACCVLEQQRPAAVHHAVSRPPCNKTQTCMLSTPMKGTAAGSNRQWLAPWDLAALQGVEVLRSIKPGGAGQRRQEDLGILCAAHQLRQQPTPDAAAPAALEHVTSSPDSGLRVIHLLPFLQYSTACCIRLRWRPLPGAAPAGPH